MTLLFFGAMFITMECLARLGLYKWIGIQTKNLILLFDEDMRLALAIIIILWVNLSICVVDKPAKSTNLLLLLYVWIYS